MGVRKILPRPTEQRLRLPEDGVALLGKGNATCFEKGLLMSNRALKTERHVLFPKHNS